MSRGFAERGVAGAGAAVDELPRGIASFPPAIPQNPYQRLLYEELAGHGFALVNGFRLKLGSLWRHRRQVSVLHFHWPQGYYVSPVGSGRLELALTWVRIGAFGVRLLAARALGYRIVWTVHEVIPHESISRRADKAGGFVLARMSSVLISHDRATADTAERTFRLRRGRVTVIPHASYAGVYPPGRDRETVRAELGVSEAAFVFLAFGHIRAYKDLELLLASFASVPRQDIVLVVAGLLMDEHSGEVIEGAAARDPRVRTLLEFVPDERVAELFDASDAVVISRRDGGTSGALVLALTLGVPVVAARLQAYEVLTDDGAAGWLFAPGDQADLTAVLGAAADDSDRAAKRRAAQACGARLGWSEVGALTASLLGLGKDGR